MLLSCFGAGNIPRLAEQGCGFLLPSGAGCSGHILAPATQHLAVLGPREVARVSQLRGNVRMMDHPPRDRLWGVKPGKVSKISSCLKENLFQKMQLRQAVPV